MATTSVIFSLVDSENDRFYSKIYISPISYPLVYSGSIVVGDSVYVITSEKSPIVTVNLIPNQYECRAIGMDTSYETQYYISVPTSSVPVSASSILYNISNYTANATASYAISSSYATTASYALNGGGGGSSVWQTNGNDIINTNTGRVYITGSGLQIESSGSIYMPYLIPETVLVLDEFGTVSSGNATTTDLNNIIGTIDNVQTQLNNKYESGSLIQPSYIQTPWIDYLVDGSPLWNEGRVFYDSTQHTLCVYNDKSNVTLNVGEENWVRIVNKTGAIITNGSAVTISGSQGNRPQGVLAVSTMTSGSTSYGIIGIATEDIAINAEGMITILGAVRSINTSTFNAGDTLYVSSSAGKITNIKPAIPYEVIKIGIALNSTANGSILVSPYDVIHPSDISGYGDLTVTNNQANININTIPSNSYGRLVFRESGSEKVAIQYLNSQFDAYYTSSGRSNALEIYNNIGPTIWFNSGSERARITKDGSLIINKPGTTSSAYTVDISGSMCISGSELFFPNSLSKVRFSAYNAQINDSYGITMQTSADIRPVRVAGNSGLYVGGASGYTTPSGSIILENNVSASGYITGSRIYGGSADFNNGSGSIMIGNTLYNTTTSTSSNAIEIGTNIFNSNVSNSYSISMGYNVGYGGGMIDDTYGIIMGWYAAYGAAYTNRAVIIGSQAAQTAVTASGATYIGYQAGYGIKSGSEATCIGSQAGASTDNGFAMTAVGSGAGNQGSTYGVYVGLGAGQTAATSSGAVILGKYAGYYSTQSADSVMVGRETGFRSILADKSVFVGALAGYYNYASGSICVGYSAGYSNKTGSNNTFIGYGSDTITDTVTVSNSVAIGPYSRIHQNNTMTLGGTGSYAMKVGIGSNTPTYNLEVVGTVSASSYIGTNVNTTYVTGSNIYGGIVSASAYSASNAGFYCPGNTADSGIKVGSYEIQGFGLNNAWLSENCYYNGSAFKARNTGYISMVYNQSPEIQYRISSTSITAGATWSPTVIAKFYGVTNTCAFGGSLSTNAGVYTGAVLVVSGSGLVGINNITPSYSLDVNGTTRSTNLILPVTPPATPATGSCYYSNSMFYVFTGVWKSASLA